MSILNIPILFPLSKLIEEDLLSFILIVPFINGELIIGVVNVLFDKQSIVLIPTKVSELLGKVIVLFSVEFIINLVLTFSNDLSRLNESVLLLFVIRFILPDPLACKLRSISLFLLLFELIIGPDLSVEFDINNSFTALGILLNIKMLLPLISVIESPLLIFGFINVLFVSDCLRLSITISPSLP